MAKFEEQDDVKLRYGLAVKKLIEKNKKINVAKNKKGITWQTLDDSYSTIYSSTGLRPATLSAIVNGASEIKGYTLYQILNSLGYTYIQFGRVFDSIGDKELASYREEINNKKQERR